MSKEDQYLEQNTARLIWAAYGSDARPRPHASGQTFQLLQRSLRARSTVADFPDAAVGICGSVLIVLAIWTALRVALGGASVMTEPPQLVAIVWLAVNLASMPIAGIVVLRRRQNG